MKKIVSAFVGNGLLPIAVLSCILIAGCSDSKDYSKEGDTSNLSGTDTLAVNSDTSMNSGNMVMTGDTAAIIGDSAAKVPMANPNTNKISKKGKVSIVKAEMATSKNTSMEMDKEGFYKNTEVLPAFPGGQKELERFFEKNIEYPEQATENDAQGIVKLIFSVDENGKIYQPLTVGDKVGYGIEEEAIRVFNKMPKWTPGKIKGKNVKTRYTLPINFQLY
ncbi:MAG: energy transducer TonB [Ferruginibacter sp.]|nr:energy transducer TonB [Ferruginibacter sp.]